ncbi:Asp-tRNA(Asn)/Glu-tRNA(Gln) amidotransferase subunit GatA [Marinobacter nanhaiticus D15-8W]|uniref:Glutamyl-tRNA(Gln) amidotransferase subunit A n=1 Tax=Marinobacter nanhaiticus D15-8W TaxID=626887 RepID=N6VZM0_9GAMM|nr:Asp-tRNA(Asn)/Glu-tRNA(Gln) amidotransferase subunit GatA [Marinobacter nanhaiticus]ENO13349.1 Asp-tRNA(Asn)/Glu-tRNA(Gln) amidotransferase subunit GatA [Marinobacter nanhaiticus D15-8W]BES70717.1 Asp-tRNA(Asn)/Glu-tRNA(Gln) amidotransferase subunit GatA [Marinobacter nanhaiticus D15-8W]
MHDKTVAELARELEQGKVSSLELTQHFLGRIKQEDTRYNSFITVTEEEALRDAKAADELRAKGEATPWTGIPFAHKDIFCTNGVRTTCGSRMLENFVPPYDATVTARLRGAGAVCLGKTNMDEFAMGSSTESSYFGPTRNPWGDNRVPGGSSGGSAAAVAARLVPAATATDTGGSIRQPAALCGVSGLKPTYGRVSRYGMIAFASSLDQGGTMARTAEDNAMMLNVMAGFDPKDSTCIDKPVPDYTATLNEPLKGLKIGLPKEYFTDQLDSEMAQQVRAAIGEYEKLGATVQEISLPNTHLAIAAYYVIAPAEASANLSRFDGVRYGYRCEDPKDLLDLYTRTRAEGFGEEVKRRILIGSYALSAGYYDAYYLKAQKVRRLIQQDFIEAFNDVDVIMGPSSPTPAFALGSKTDDPVKMYLEDIYTIAINLAGVPAMSIPAGQINGLPVGLQLIGNYFDESRLLNAAHQYQQVTDWHNQAPQGGR